MLLGAYHYFVARYKGKTATYVEIALCCVRQIKLNLLCVLICAIQVYFFLFCYRTYFAHAVHF